MLQFLIILILFCSLDLKAHVIQASNIANRDVRPITSEVTTAIIEQQALRTIDFDKLSFEYNGNSRLNLKALNENFWTTSSKKALVAKFTIFNDTNQTQKFFLNGRSFPVKKAILYDGQTIIGRIELGQEDQNRQFEIELAPDAIKDYYLVLFPSLVANLSLELTKDYSRYFIQQIKTKTSIRSSIAIVAMNILFASIIYLAYRDKTYLYYIGQLLSFGLWLYFILEYNNIVPHHFDGVTLTTAIIPIFGVLFSVNFLDLKHYRKLYLFFKLCLIVFLGVFALTLIDYQSGFQLVQICSGILTPLSLISGIYVYFKNRKPHVLIYCLGYGAIILGGMATILHNHGIVTGTYMMNGFQSGGVLQSVLMLLALAQKITNTEKQRRHIFKEMDKLIYPHQRKLLARGHALETTMPVGQHEASIIAFDVIGSSKIKSKDFPKYWEMFMVRVRNSMMKAYDGDRMLSQGYIIKEVGDGFFASVGFPFKALKENQSDAAISLAIDLLEDFKAVMSHIESEPIHCSIGMAMGKVEGYFSQSGVIRHDLWGKAVVKATRYEKFRSPMFSILAEEKTNVLILQQELYEKASPSVQAKFTLLDLHDQPYKVRDDAAAKKLFYYIDKHSELQQTEIAS